MNVTKDLLLNSNQIIKCYVKLIYWYHLYKNWNAFVIFQQHLFNNLLWQARILEFIVFLYLSGKMVSYQQHKIELVLIEHMLHMDMNPYQRTKWSLQEKSCNPKIVWLDYLNHVSFLSGEQTNRQRYWI